MKTKLLAITLSFVSIVLMLAGCTTNIVMPHSSEEYVSGDWNLKDLQIHFEDLGFSEVEICGNTTTIVGVYAENDEGLYDSFDKGQEISPYRKIGIYTEFESTEPISVDTSAEFASFIEKGNDDAAAWNSFLKKHVGEPIVFDGTITNWYDKFFWVGVDFTIAVEDSDSFTFSKSNVELIDLGMTGDYHYNKYSAGLIAEGMRVHVITEITEKDGAYAWELDSMSVIE